MAFDYLDGVESDGTVSILQIEQQCLDRIVLYGLVFSLGSDRNAETLEAFPLEISNAHFGRQFLTVLRLKILVDHSCHFSEGFLGAKYNFTSLRGKDLVIKYFP